MTNGQATGFLGRVGTVSDSTMLLGYRHEVVFEGYLELDSTFYVEYNGFILVALILGEIGQLRLVRCPAATPRGTPPRRECDRNVTGRVCHGRHCHICPTLTAPSLALSSPSTSPL